MASALQSFLGVGGVAVMHPPQATGSLHNCWDTDSRSISTLHCWEIGLVLQQLGGCTLPGLNVRALTSLGNVWATYWSHIHYKFWMDKLQVYHLCGWSGLRHTCSYNLISCDHRGSTLWKVWEHPPSSRLVLYVGTLIHYYEPIFIPDCGWLALLLIKTVEEMVS